MTKLFYYSFVFLLLASSCDSEYDKTQREVDRLRYYSDSIIAANKKRDEKLINSDGVANSDDSYSMADSSLENNSDSVTENTKMLLESIKSEINNIQNH